MREKEAMEGEKGERERRRRKSRRSKLSIIKVSILCNVQTLDHIAPKIFLKKYVRQKSIFSVLLLFFSSPHSQKSVSRKRSATKKLFRDLLLIRARLSVRKEEEDAKKEREGHIVEAQNRSNFMNWSRLNYKSTLVRDFFCVQSPSFPPKKSLSKNSKVSLSAAQS